MGGTRGYLAFAAQDHQSIDVARGLIADLILRGLVEDEKKCGLIFDLRTLEAKFPDDPEISNVIEGMDLSGSCFVTRVPLSDSLSEENYSQPLIDAIKEGRKAQLEGEEIQVRVGAYHIDG